jgi:hypothetical protein
VRIEKATQSAVNSYAPVTGKFISAVWRRIVLIRIAESIAIAIAVASAAGFALIPILWWQRQSAMPLACAMLLLGAISGLIWGISRRPTRFEAAVEADRQLNLHDLLGTIHLLTNHSSDPWRESLANVADARCRSLHPSAVIVNRLGLRAWTGVGILGALLVTTGLFTARPINTNAAAIAMESNNPISLQAIQPSIAFANQNQQTPSRPPGTGGTDDISNRVTDESQPDDLHSETPSQANRGETHSTAGPSLSGGGGAATTDTKQPTPDSLTPIDAGPHSSHTGKSSAGPADPNAITSGDSTAVTASEKSNQTSPPWTSTDWPADSNAAQAAINSGRVPDSDADLVRDYFRRD